jgi:prefoldin subunit 5
MFLNNILFFTEHWRLHMTTYRKMMMLIGVSAAVLSFGRSARAEGNPLVCETRVDAEKDNLIGRIIGLEEKLKMLETRFHELDRRSYEQAQEQARQGGVLAGISDRVKAIEASVDAVEGTTAEEASKLAALAQKTDSELELMRAEASRGFENMTAERKLELVEVTARIEAIQSRVKGVRVDVAGIREAMKSPGLLDQAIEFIKKGAPIIPFIKSFSR